MAKYRIKAYFVHEHEQAAAKQAVDSSVIADAEWTPGFVMGVVDGPKIKALQKQGLVVSVIEEIAPAGQAPRPVETALASSLARQAVPQKRGLVPLTTEKKKPKSKVLSQDETRTQFYVVRFHGSLTPNRQNALRESGIKLIERLSRNKYTVQLKPSEVKTLAHVPFVDWLRIYDAADTLRIPDAGELKPAPTRRPRKVTGTPRTLVYAVKLHQAKGMSAVVKWLASRKRKPLWKRGDQLQVALVEDSKTWADLVKRPEVAFVEPLAAPRLADAPARKILGLVRNNVTVGLEGAGEIIGVADTGIDKTHPDLANRIAGVSAWGRKNDVSDPEGHGTHVAGCVVGDGTASHGEVMGAAPKAKVFFQSILDPNGGLGGLPRDLGELLKEAYENGARIHNDSWGAFNFARYSLRSLEVDRFVAAHPDMLVVIAAGNDSIGIPRAVGAKMNAANGFVDWPSVDAPATAKNGLTVGASRSSRTTGGYAELTWNDAWPDRYPLPPISRERISSKDQCLAAFSSRGPCDDQRIKPDVVAPGTDIAAAKSKDAPLFKFWGAYPNSNCYGFMGGTSMAAPYVAGCAALVREWYRKKGGWATPSAALLKATLINGTYHMTGDDAIAAIVGDPNFHQGFGRIDMANSIPNPLSPGLKLAYDDTWKDPARMFTPETRPIKYRVKVGHALTLRICLAWTDPGARALQNSLLLLVDDGKGKKWVGNAQAATLLNIAAGPRDPNNNVQVVRIENPKPGDYTIAVAGSMVLIPPQSFALVVTGDLGSDLTPM